MARIALHRCQMICALGGRMLTDNELGELVLMLQAKSPLHQLSNMEARTVFELMQQRGYKIARPAND